jgi:hypothetical protein
MQPPQQQGEDPGGAHDQANTFIRFELFRFINYLLRFSFIILVAVIAGFVSRRPMERWFQSPVPPRLSDRFPVPKPLTASVPLADIAQMLRYRSSLNHFSDGNSSDRCYGLLKDISLSSIRDDTYFTTKLEYFRDKEIAKR